MSKSKKNKNKWGLAQNQKITPERFMREKARTLPLGKCFVTKDWQKAGIAQIFVTRIRPDKKIAMGIFLVDTFCTGVKDSSYYIELSENRYNEILSTAEKTLGIDEIGYNEAHNIIYGAISFAAEGGISPDTSFNISGFMLEKDTDDVPRRRWMRCVW